MQSGQFTRAIHSKYSFNACFLLSDRFSLWLFYGLATVGLHSGNVCVGWGGGGGEGGRGENTEKMAGVVRRVLI